MGWRRLPSVSLARQPFESLRLNRDFETRSGESGIKAVSDEQHPIAKRLGIEAAAFGMPPEMVGRVARHVFALLRVDRGLAIGGAGDELAVKAFEGGSGRGGERQKGSRRNGA